MTRQQFAKIAATLAVALSLIVIAANIMRSRSLSNIRGDQENVRIQQESIQARVDVLKKEKPPVTASEIKTRQERLNEIQKDLDAVAQQSKDIKNRLH